MVFIRKTSKLTPPTRSSGPSSIKGTQRSSSTASPFAIKPPDSLKGITERKTRLSEIQKLAILQMALQSYAKEAEGKLSPDLQKMKEEIRQKMITEGFAKEVAQEAAEEAVTVVLQKRAD